MAYNTAGKWHVGVKHLYELVPAGLKKRIKQDRRKLWDEQQSLSIAKAWSDLSKHSKTPKPGSTAASPKQPSSTSAEGNDPEAVEAKEKDTGSKDSKQSVSQKLIKEELQARVDLLKELAEGYDDPGTPATSSAATPAHAPAITPAAITAATPAAPPAVDPAVTPAVSPAVTPAVTPANTPTFTRP